MGVLIDDLITRGAPEPYRMFTSRAEYRLMLREDNADLRLTAFGYELGCVSEERWQAFNRKCDAIASEQQRLKDLWIRPNTPAADALAKVLAQALQKEQRAIDLLKRPDITYDLLMSLPEIGPGIAATDAAEQIEIQEKYAGYIERQTAEIARQRRHEETRLPADINYDKVTGLSTEVRQILQQAKPATIGLAARLPGVTPAAISLLLIHLKKRTYKQGEQNKQADLEHESE
jgi:tRNA uridine 5-carboxymethylaminomethyl modification enzyme